MIAKCIIRRALKSFSKSTRDLSRFSYKDIRRVLCLVDFDKSLDTKNLSNIVRSVAIRGGHVCFIYFVEDKDKLRSFENKAYWACKRDYNLLGNPKSKKLKKALSLEYDLLINYFDEAHPFILKYSASVKSKLRVGFSVAPLYLNDVVFSSDMKDLKVFEKQMIKYLKVINNDKN